ncbi:MAG: nucleotidyltransferase family protein [Terriglobia bacterium]|jgi:NDP-sugar pyrophosphorylase family protein|nr:nucleotidyltransferase family protein [Terriglobia bacterium]
MKAMVLAAGLGTRLRPLTNDRPKALVEICGKTLLEITLARLREFGIREVIVNAHHFADILIEYLKAHDNFGMAIEVSREEVLLDTGGGLKNAASFFRGSDEPFVLHNVDVLSTIDMNRMIEIHREHGALSTLAVQHRKTSRYLLFDNDLRLCGRRIGGDEEVVRTAPQVEALAFCGIHVLSPRIFGLMKEEGAFSIIDAYLRLAAKGENIRGFRADEYYWRDLGKPENIAQAERDIRQNIVPG